MTTRLILLILTICLSNVSFSQASSEEALNAIETITTQLTSVTHPRERAKWLCYRARNYAKVKENKKAEYDYLQALEAYKEGRIIPEFPDLKNEGTKLMKSSKSKWEEKELAENPPTITLDKEPDSYVSRHDLMRQTQAKTYTITNNPSQNPSPKNSGQSKSGGSHIRGFGINSDLRQNYKKSRQ